MHNMETMKKLSIILGRAWGAWMNVGWFAPCGEEPRSKLMQMYKK